MHLNQGELSMTKLSISNLSNFYIRCFPVALAYSNPKSVKWGSYLFSTYPALSGFLTRSARSPCLIMSTSDWLISKLSVVAVD